MACRPRNKLAFVNRTQIFFTGRLTPLEQNFEINPAHYMFSGLHFSAL